MRCTILTMPNIVSVIRNFVAGRKILYTGHSRSFRTTRRPDLSRWAQKNFIYRGARVFFRFFEASVLVILIVKNLQFPMTLKITVSDKIQSLGKS